LISATVIHVSEKLKILKNPAPESEPTPVGFWSEALTNKRHSRTRSVRLMFRITGIIIQYISHSTLENFSIRPYVGGIVHLNGAIVMPIYEYECSQCAHRIEVLQKISDAPLQDCPECNQPSLRKLVSAASFRLKGTGWYETDFKNKDKPKTATKEKQDHDKDSKNKDTSVSESPPKESKSEESKPKESKKPDTA